MDTFLANLFDFINFLAILATGWATLLLATALYTRLKGSGKYDVIYHLKLAAVGWVYVYFFVIR